MGEFHRKRHFTSARIIIMGFASVILAGSLLLMLPVATRSGQSAPFLDALFTSTSATCVTGLVVHDTAQYWSVFGQAVILCLIQVGGMGVITVAIAFTALSRKKIGLMERSTMQEAISAHQVGGVVRLTRTIVKATILIELAGAAALAPRFCADFGLGKGLWYSLFHSISAFCNAGFDLMGIQGPYSSLVHYAGDPLVNITIMLLIIVGGIGFLTWTDVASNKLHFHKYKMQTKVIIVSTLILISVPTLYVFFCEFAGRPGQERLLASLFQSVTARTAGFNTVDLTQLHETGLAILIILMIIGGSPGSTAGGIKTTTFAVLVGTAGSVFTKRESASFFGRRISNDTLRDAITVILMYIMLTVTGALIISYRESLPLLTTLFEASSAIGTVGLSLGITSSVGVVSRLILIFLMFFGRVGGLTLVFAAFSDKTSAASRYPVEKIMVC